MSRGDPFRFDEEDSDQPRRRRDPDDFDDDRPSRRRRRDDASDDYGDDPRPPRRAARPGNGTAIGGLICGIVGIVIAVGSGGCVFCCLLFLPISLVVAIVAAILGVVAIVLGLVSRSQGNSTQMPIWDIVLGAVAILLAIVAIVLPIVFVANLPAPPPQNNQFQKQPAPPRPNFNNNPKRP